MTPDMTPDGRRQDAPAEWGGKWVGRVRLRLALHHKLPAEVVDDVIAEVRTAGQDSGTPLEELFGPADEFAAETARERKPLADRAAEGPRGELLAGRRELLVGNGVVGVVITLGMALTGGLGDGVSLGAVLVLAGVLGSSVALAFAARARFAGRLQRSVVLAGLVLASSGAGIAAALLLGDAKDTDLGPTPVLVLAVLSVTAVVLGCVLPPAPPGKGADLDPDEWFERLDGVLRGRWLLTAAEAGRLTQDTRAYWVDAGSPPPGREFGDPAEHAFGLVDASPVPAARAARWTALGFTALTVLWVFLLVADLVDGVTGWGVLLRGVVAVLVALRAVGAWRNVLRARVATAAR